MKKFLLLILLLLVWPVNSFEEREFNEPEALVNFLRNKFNSVWPQLIETDLQNGIKIRILKADFDSNGIDDILYSGSITFVILHIGQDKFDLQPIVIRKYIDMKSQLAEVKKIDKLNLINLRFQNDKKPDTLVVFTRDGFIEYNSNPSNHRINKIVLNAHRCLEDCPVFSFEIDKQGNFVTTKDGSATRKKLISGKIKVESFQEIVDLLNYMSFPRLSEKYETTVTDQQSVDVEIFYDDGKVKSIYDYGLEGTLGLQILYRKLFSLREQHLRK